jgi:cell division protein FtsA
VVDASQAISIPPNREIIHVIPKAFTLDGQTGIKDPLGMTGIRLEVDTLLVHGSLPFLKNLSKAIMQTGLSVDQLVLAPLAASHSVLSKRQKELGVVLVDMGAGTTSLAVFEENNLLHTAVIPVGGMHITNDIAIGLRCTIDTAERVKLQFGHSDPKSIDKHAEVDLATLDPEEHEKVSQGHVAEIIEARLEEIFEYVERELKLISRDGKLPAGVVLTGGGSKIPGLAEFVKKQLRLPTQVGAVVNIETIIDQVTDPSFATAAGLALWGGRFQGPGGGSAKGFLGGFSGLFENQTMGKLRKLFKSFLP